MSDPMRDAFEAWARPRLHRFAHPFIRFENGDGTDSYSLYMVEDMWQSWQVATSHKTVVTDSMVEAAARRIVDSIIDDDWDKITEAARLIYLDLTRDVLTAALTVEGE